jgi:hypothetical protein
LWKPKRQRFKDAITLIAQKVVPLKPLLESEEKEEQIALVMSSFFDIDEGEFEEKKILLAQFWY